MSRIVVDVMPKPEILDPQGKAIVGALPRLGFTEFSGVRQGKRFELEVDGPVTEEILESARSAAATLLSNPVIEDVVAITVLDDDEDPAAQERLGDAAAAVAAEEGAQSGTAR